MTSAIDQFLAVMSTTLSWTSDQLPANQAAADTYFPTTPSDLASQVTAFVSNAGVRDDSYNTYFTGTPTGGPSGNGTYPITLYGGGTVTLPCPAKLAQMMIRGADAQTGMNFSVVGPFNANELLGSVCTPTGQVLIAASTVGRCRLVPTADVTLILKVNGTQIGTVTYQANYHNHVTSTLSNNVLNPGDSLELWSGAGAVDVTFQDFSLTLTNGA